MNWATLLFYGWMQLACIPDGAVELYENPVPDLVTLDGSYFAELGAEITWGCFFAGGAMRVPMWWDAESVTFWPTQLESTFDVGVKYEGLRAGYMHVCAHAVTPELGVIQWIGRQIVPRWDSNYDMIYLRIEGGQR
jgi:hypothetical protein